MTTFQHCAYQETHDHIIPNLILLGIIETWLTCKCDYWNLKGICMLLLVMEPLKWVSMVMQFIDLLCLFTISLDIPRSSTIKKTILIFIVWKEDRSIIERSIRQWTIRVDERCYKPVDSQNWLTSWLLLIAMRVGPVHAPVF